MEEVAVRKPLSFGLAGSSSSSCSSSKTSTSTTGLLMDTNGGNIKNRSSVNNNNNNSSSSSSSNNNNNNNVDDIFSSSTSGNSSGMSSSGMPDPPASTPATTESTDHASSSSTTTTSTSSSSSSSSSSSDPSAPHAEVLQMAVRMRVLKVGEVADPDEETFDLDKMRVKEFLLTVAEKDKEIAQLQETLYKTKSEHMKALFFVDIIQQEQNVCVEMALQKFRLEKDREIALLRAQMKEYLSMQSLLTKACNDLTEACRESTVATTALEKERDELKRALEIEQQRTREPAQHMPATTTHRRVSMAPEVSTEALSSSSSSLTMSKTTRKRSLHVRISTDAHDQNHHHTGHVNKVSGGEDGDEEEAPAHSPSSITAAADTPRLKVPRSETTYFGKDIVARSAAGCLGGLNGFTNGTVGHGFGAGYVVAIPPAQTIPLSASTHHLHTQYAHVLYAPHGNNDSHSGWKVVNTAMEWYKELRGDVPIPPDFVVPRASDEERWPEETWGLALGAVVSEVLGTAAARGTSRGGHGDEGRGNESAGLGTLRVPSSDNSPAKAITAR